MHLASRRREIPEAISEAEAEAYMSILAPLLNLSLDPAYHEGVIANLRVLLAHAAIVNSFNAAFDLAPAPEFIP
jgi:hypothetical protein